LISIRQDVRNTKEAEHDCAVREIPSNPAGVHHTDFLSSTPQNTPASAAPISSHSQVPTVGTIKEGLYSVIVDRSIVAHF
jgi:hypothetical protein